MFRTAFAATLAVAAVLTGSALGDGTLTRTSARRRFSRPVP